MAPCSVLVMALAVAACASAASTMPGQNKCTWGPSFWCASTANAKQCQFPVSECKSYCESGKYAALAKSDICKAVPAPTDTPGSNKCTQGPSFWCASTANAKLCKIPVSECKSYCESGKDAALAKSDICKAVPTPTDTPGSNKCTQGPSFWCASTANAKLCKIPVSECKSYCESGKDAALAKSDICKAVPATTGLPGSDKCTWGPSYWCTSFSNAKKCKVDTKECKTYCKGASTSLSKNEVCASLKL